MNVIYSKKNYNIYKVNKNSFIVHNTSKQFEYGHTHISNYKTAKYIINLALHHTVPDRLNRYLVESIIRISTNKGYIRLMEALL